MAAGVHLAVVLRSMRNAFASCIGSASMSARRPMARVELPRRSVPTTPVLASPR
jgi:hypothetical protein